MTALVEALGANSDLTTADIVMSKQMPVAGKVFVEYLSPLKRDRIRTRLLKRAREEQRA